MIYDNEAWHREGCPDPSIDGEYMQIEGELKISGSELLMDNRVLQDTDTVTLSCKQIKAIIKDAKEGRI